MDLLVITPMLAVALDTSFEDNMRLFARGSLAN
jgi:hypothetical protein